MKILEGIKVIDLTVWAFCPAAGAILASWGAEVIHIENPASPDPMRLFDGGSVEPGRANWMFKHYNRGKKGIAIDLASEEGREVFLRLIEDADIFLTSYLPGTRRKLGIDLDVIRERNPNIIIAKGTGQGPLGPEAERGGYDGATWWSRGSLASSSMAVAGVERPPGMTGHGDGMSGLVLAGGICAALANRERTGTPTVVDGSLMASAMWFNAPAIISSTFNNGPGAFNSKPSRSDLPWVTSTFRTSDGRFLYLSLLGDPQPYWVDLCERIDRKDLLDDVRFADAEARRAHNGELVAELDATFEKRTLKDWSDAFATMKAVWAPIQTPREMHDDPQTIANNWVQPVSYPDGDLPLVTAPIMFDEDAGQVGRAPDFGEHTTDVLTAANFDQATIADYRARGVIA